jgi:cell division protein FtsI (penicillin-binding protein 3)
MSRPLDRFLAPKGSKRKRRRFPVAPAVPRIRVLLVVIGVVFSLAAGRAVQVQAIDASVVATQAADQITVNHVLPAFRGEITDRNGEVLAMTADTVTVIASPKMIATNGRMGAQMTTKDKEIAATAPQKVADLLAQHLGGSAASYLSKLTVASSGYQVVGKQVSTAAYRALAQAMASANLVGLSSESSPTRSYPNGVLASNVIGFVNGQSEGASGLEYALNAELSGTPGKEIYQSSPSGEKIPLGNSASTPAVDGVDYQLTIDSGLQLQAEKLVAAQVRSTKAKAGWAVVTNPKTGEILAMVNYPSFNSNQPNESKSSDLGNRVVTEAYTPGSVQKTLTFAALLDQGLVDPNEVVVVPGKIKSGSDWVEDSWKHGDIKLYARGVLAKSSNVGTIKLARRATKQSLHDYMVSFGLGSKTNLGLPGETSGTLPAADMPDYSRDGLAFGGSAESVNMVQMAAAVGTLANGGVYNPPQILKSRTLADGTTEQLSSGDTHRVVSVDTAGRVLSMMEAMAEGNDHFDVSGYRIGAKTGTSKKYNSSCNCFKGLVTSAVAVAPVENPQVLVYVVIDSPKKGASGSAVAAPVVQKLTSLALARYAVPQSTTKAPKLPVKP